MRVGQYHITFGTVEVRYTLVNVGMALVEVTNPLAYNASVLIVTV